MQKLKLNDLKMRAKRKELGDVLLKERLFLKWFDKLYYK